MKECKVIQINDGDMLKLTDGNWHCAQEAVWAGEMLAMYLNEGYEIVQMYPEFDPGMGRPGEYTFYKGGFTVVLVREVTPDSRQITPEDWEAANVRNLYDERIRQMVEEHEAEEAAEDDEEDLVDEFDFSEEVDEEDDEDLLEDFDLSDEDV